VPPDAPGGAPDFIGIGTHLSGSDWWFDKLAEHPRITGPTGGEGSLGFFEPFCGHELADDDVDAYHARFPRRPGEIAGEWTPRYLFDAWTLPLLRRAAPEARLLVLLRDPIERYRLSLGYRLGERRPPDEVIIMAEAVHRGRYASQLRALTAFFDPERVLVLQTERCQLDPLGEYARTLRFLGLDDDFVPRTLRRRARGKTGPILPVAVLRKLGLPEQVNLDWLRRLRGRVVPVDVELWPDLVASLRTELTPEVEALRELVPDLDLSLWPFFADLAPAGAPAPARAPAAAAPRPFRAAHALLAAAVAGVSAAATALVLALVDVI
jgi:hypothetical protein